MGYRLRANSGRQIDDDYDLEFTSTKKSLMTQDEKIKAETRLCALEVSVTHLWVMMIHLAGGEPQETLQRRRKAVIESARNITLSGIDPAMHVQASAKLEDAVRRLFDMQEESLAELRRRTDGL